MQALCWLLGLLAAIAAIGLGQRGTGSGIAREGFVKAKGGYIEGLPAK